MGSQRILTGVSEAIAHEWFSTCFMGEALVKGQVFVNPWVLRYDDQAQLIELQNATPELLRQVQFFALTSDRSFKSLPTKVAPGVRVSFDVAPILGCSALNHEPSMYVRWLGPLGEELAWPIVW